MIRSDDDRPILCGLSRTRHDSATARQADIVALAELIDEPPSSAGPAGTALSALAARMRSGRCSAADIVQIANRIVADAGHEAPDGVRPSRRRLLATAALVAVVVSATIAVAGASQRGERRLTSGPEAAEPTADPGGPAQTRAGPVTATTSETRSPSDLRTGDGLLLDHRGRRYRVGREGDIVVIGDWDCDGDKTPAVLRPATGEIAVFDHWPDPDGSISVPATWNVDSAHGLATEKNDEWRSRCGCGPPTGRGSSTKEDHDERSPRAGLPGRSAPGGRGAPRRRTIVARPSAGRSAPARRMVGLEWDGRRHLRPGKDRRPRAQWLPGRSGSGGNPRGSHQMVMGRCPAHQMCHTCGPSVPRSAAGCSPACRCQRSEQRMRHPSSTWSTWDRSQQNYTIQDMGPVATEFTIQDMGPVATEFTIQDMGPVRAGSEAQEIGPERSIRSEAVSERPVEPAVVESELATWVVTRGDHLWSIASETVADRHEDDREATIAAYWLRLIDENRDVVDETPDLIYPGQVIRLPN